MRCEGGNAGDEVELVAGGEVEVAFAVVVFVVPDGDALGAVDGEGVSVDGE